MRIISIFFIYLLSIVILEGCINKKSTGIVEEISSISLVGAYVGDLPCVDCDAISTVLQLGQDHSYKLTYTYDGKSSDSFVREGSWVIKKNHLVLKGLDYIYKIEPDYLVQLDLSGQEITGELADKYQLAKIK